MKKSTPLKILFASSEVTPFAKTGGLADVSGSLPPALASLGHQVVVVMPLYRSAREDQFKLKIS
jgi:starch synthase